MRETEAWGLEAICAKQQELGTKVRALLASKGFKSVAAEPFAAPGVVGSYTEDPEIKSGSKFSAAGLQLAAGVPLKCDEDDNFQTFRIGLFGMDKLRNVDQTVATLGRALDQIVA